MTKLGTPLSPSSPPIDRVEPSNPLTVPIPESANVTGVAADFANQANEITPSLLRELVDFLREYRVWWLTPLIVVLLFLAGLVFLGGTAAAPFIYPLW